jgi:SAM-dependent methyltransferase
VEDYLATNRANWDERAPAHAASPDYAFEQFLKDPGFISHVVRFDMPLLGDVSGLRGLHLQCHIGTDTVSLARLGAQMTGLDFSPPALEQARRLAAGAGVEAEFVEALAYDAVEALGGERFDLLYTGIGAICWLPDIDRWGALVAELLAPGGRFFMREGHPMLSTIDETHPDLLVVGESYFERPEPLIWDEDGTYVETDVEFAHTRSASWNHGLAETIGALTAHGLLITGFVEHESVPWDALPGQMEPIGGGEFRLIDRPWRLPHTFTLQAVKPPA